jgi:hypothetical protein
MRRETKEQMYDWVADDAGGDPIPGSLARTLGGSAANLINRPESVV